MNSTDQNHAPTASSQDVGGSGSNQQNTDSVDQQDGTNINDTVFDEDGDEVVGSKMATRSLAWQHFIKFNLNGEVKARCKYCSKVLGADSKNGTKHLLAHHKRCIHKPFTDIRQSILVHEKKKVDVPGSSSFGSSISSGHRVGFKKLLSDIASITRDDDESGAFSTSGRLVCPHRNRLHPKTLEALMCAQSWLLNEIRATCSEETEAYCRSVEFDYDVEEENTKESGTTSLDDFV
ncbi:unnamed protein product [Lactuca saligna]|uniref:BED-type domain-containing protein n=1 Tax=Lactuca saligna TaxID=75948 RepID=A0AA35ZKM1_LACSI|nr:unnamed protein product [Lactuca saligna]